MKENSRPDNVLIPKRRKRKKRAALIEPLVFPGAPSAMNWVKCHTRWKEAISPRAICAVRRRCR